MTVRIGLAMWILGVATLVMAATAWTQDASSGATGPPMPPPSQSGGPPPFPPSPEQLDANSDGSITSDEYTAAWAKATKDQFSRLDADENTVLSKEELSKNRGPRHEGNSGGRPGDGGQDGPNGNDSRPPMPPSGQAGRAPGPVLMTVEQLDADSNGSVTLDEYSTAWSKVVKAQFKQFDANSDSVLSSDEIPKHGRPRQGPGPGGQRH